MNRDEFLIEASRAGEAYSVSSGLTEVPPNTTRHLRFLFENPAGSNVETIFPRFVVYSSVPVFMEVVVVPLTNLPQTPLKILRYRSDQPASRTKAYSEVGPDPMTGLASSTLGIPKEDRRVIDDFPFMHLAPGSKIGGSIELPQLTEFTVTVYFVEKGLQ